MPNVKLGNDTLNGVNTVRLQSADGGGLNRTKIIETKGVKICLNFCKIAV